MYVYIWVRRQAGDATRMSGAPTRNRKQAVAQQAHEANKPRPVILNWTTIQQPSWSRTSAMWWYPN